MWGAGNASNYARASLFIEERELTNALIDTTAQWRWGEGDAAVL